MKISQFPTANPGRKIHIIIAYAIRNIRFVLNSERRFNHFKCALQISQNTIRNAEEKAGQSYSFSKLLKINPQSTPSNNKNNIFAKKSAHIIFRFGRRTIPARSWLIIVLTATHAYNDIMKTNKKLSGKYRKAAVRIFRREKSENAFRQLTADDCVVD